MKIDLYLEGQPVELDNDFSMALTYSFSDLEDPAAITGDFSKEMTIKGTPANNALFGQIWRFDRKMIPNDATNLSIYFNASKRTDAQILIGGAVLKSGYVKLTGISNKNGLIQYKIVFYSKMCEVLHTISEQKLRDLPFPNNLQHTLNAQTVASAWTNTPSGVFEYLTYLMSNSGLYEEFESSKWLQKNGDEFVVTDILNGVELDELATGEYRSYYQRPALKIKPLIDLIAQQYNITLDQSFFNENNPYYANSVMSLPRYTMSGFDATSSATDANYGNYMDLDPNDSSNTISFTPQYRGDGVRFGETFSQEINIEGYGNKELAIEFSFGVTVNVNQNNYLEYAYVGLSESTINYQPFYPDVYLIIDGQQYKMTPYLQYGVGILRFELFGGVSGAGYFYDRVESGGPGYFYKGYTPNGRNYTGAIPVRFTINNIPVGAKTATVKVVFNVPQNGRYLYDPDNKAIDTVDSYAISLSPIQKAPTTGVVNLDNYFPYTAGFTDKDATFSDFKKIRSGYDVTKKEIIDDELTVGEFLIEYCKLFGLLFTTDDSGKLSIISRNEFFRNPTIEDWTEKVDRSKAMEITPLTFDVSKFVMKYADGGTFYEDYYKDKTGSIYGSQEIRTGYEFENNEKNVFEETIFNTPITSKEATRVLVGNKMIFITDNPALPALFEKDGATRVQSDSKYHLLFYRGLKDVDLSRGNKIIISDDNSQMLNEDIGGGQYCWTDFSTVGTDGCVSMTKYPSFSTMDESGERSWLFGVPLENYAGLPPAQVPENSMIYKRFWARYFADVYSIDNKRMTAYIKLSQCDMNQLSFANFVRIDDAIWHVNKVIDYNPASDGTTKVEFVQVHDLTAYGPIIVRVERGEDYGEWQYDDPIRRRTVTPWEQDIYSDDSVGERRIGTPYTQEQTAEVSNDWDGVSFWHGYCDLDYNYIDYTKIRRRYAYADGLVRYSDYIDGDWRARRIDGQCGWVRSTVVVSDWANTGQLCNAAGTIGAYDCDGNYSVQYYRQSRILEDRYPDGTGGINSRTEYRVGGVASRTKVDGQCGWVRSTVVVSDWANTGVLCKANAQAGYDCDGTYRVQYYQQRRTLEDRYPDGSGGINRRDEYRAGSLASRQQVDGYCGYESTHYELRPYYEWQDEGGNSLSYISSSEYVSDKIYIIDTGFSYVYDGDDIILMFNKIELVTVDSTGRVLGVDAELKYDDLEVSFDESYKYNCDVDLYQTSSAYRYYIAFRKYDTQVQMRWNGDIWMTDKNTGAKIKVMLELTN